jgi:hypothetical protein
MVNEDVRSEGINKLVVVFLEISFIFHMSLDEVIE